MNNSPTVEGRRTVGLALSGGATRGVAHIGVLHALQERQIEVDYIAGTSIGALVAALHAFRVPIDDILQQARELSWVKVSSLSFSRSGFLSNRMIGEIVEKYVGDARIEDAQIPLSIVATDIATGEQITLTEGPLASAVMASTCLPGVFRPIEFDGRLLVDGFLSENVPISPLHLRGAEIIIAVNLSAGRRYREPDGIIDILLNAFEIAIDGGMRTQLSQADLLIEPRLNSMLDDEADLFETYFQEGIRSAEEGLSRLANLIKQQRSTPPSLWRRIKSWIGVGQT